MKPDITKLLNVDSYDSDSYYSSLYYPHSKWIIDSHCVRSVRIRSYSGSYFPAFGLNTEYSVRMQEHKDQNNSEYGLFTK